jgi:hypothetical protein
MVKVIVNAMEGEGVSHRGIVAHTRESMRHGVDNSTSAGHANNVGRGAVPDAAQMSNTGRHAPKMGDTKTIAQVKTTEATYTPAETAAQMSATESADMAAEAAAYMSAAESADVATATSAAASHGGAAGAKCHGSDRCK